MVTVNNSTGSPELCPPGLFPSIFCSFSFCSYLALHPYCTAFFVAQGVAQIRHRYLPTSLIFASSQHDFFSIKCENWLTLCTSLRAVYGATCLPGWNAHSATRVFTTDVRARYGGPATGFGKLVGFTAKNAVKDGVSQKKAKPLKGGDAKPLVYGYQPMTAGLPESTQDLSDELYRRMDSGRNQFQQASFQTHSVKIHSVVTYRASPHRLCPFKTSS